MRLAPRYVVVALALAALGCKGPSIHSPSSDPLPAAAPAPAPGGSVFPAAAGGVATVNNRLAASLPVPVRQTLERYVGILSSAESLDDCAETFTTIAGAGLVNEDGSLRSTIQPFSLKKDYNNVKWYAVPLKITRVDVRRNRSAGYGDTALTGTQFKIWIDKADKRTGMPAPVTILAPEGHPKIADPRVIGIGSL
jgi:hypothetical protein